MPHDGRHDPVELRSRAAVETGRRQPDHISSRERLAFAQRAGRAEQGLDDLGALLLGQRPKRSVPPLLDDLQSLLDLARWPADRLQLAVPAGDQLVMRLGLLAI